MRSDEVGRIVRARLGVHGEYGFLIAANLNPKVIQARLGHATMAETMDTCRHLFPDSEDLGRQAVDDALTVDQAEWGRNRSAL